MERARPGGQRGGRGYCTSRTKMRRIGAGLGAACPLRACWCLAWLTHSGTDSPAHTLHGANFQSRCCTVGLLGKRSHICAGIRPHPHPRRDSATSAGGLTLQYGELFSRLGVLRLVRHDLFQVEDRELLFLHPQVRHRASVVRFHILRVNLPHRAVWDTTRYHARSATMRADQAGVCVRRVGGGGDAWIRAGRVDGLGRGAIR